MKKILHPAFFFSTFLILSACFGGIKPRSNEKLNQGKVDGLVYSNPYFSFEMELDSSWVQNEIEQIKFKQPFEADLVRISNYEPDSNYIDDGFLYIYTERINPFSNDPKKYLKDLKEGLEYIIDESDSTGDIVETKIDGIPFNMFTLKLEDAENDLTTYQVFYAAPIKDYWLVISKTYCYERQRSVIEKMFKSIRFKRK